MDIIRNCCTSVFLAALAHLIKNRPRRLKKTSEVGLPFRCNALSKVRCTCGTENSAILRHIVLNLLREEDPAKCCLRAKRKKAGWDQEYLLKVLAGYMRSPYNHQQGDCIKRA